MTPSQIAKIKSVAEGSIRAGFKKNEFDPADILHLLKERSEMMEVIKYYAHDSAFEAKNYAAVSSNFRSNNAARTLLKKLEAE